MWVCGGQAVRTTHWLDCVGCVPLLQKLFRFIIDAFLSHSMLLYVSFRESANFLQEGERFLCHFIKPYYEALHFQIAVNRTPTVSPRTVDQPIAL